MWSVNSKQWLKIRAFYGKYNGFSVNTLKPSAFEYRIQCSHRFGHILRTLQWFWTWPSHSVLRVSVLLYSDSECQQESIWLLSNEDCLKVHKWCNRIALTILSEKPKSRNPTMPHPRSQQSKIGHSFWMCGRAPSHVKHIRLRYCLLGET